MVMHKVRAVFGKAGCTCGWTSKFTTSNIKKSWKAHVSRVTG